MACALNSDQLIHHVLPINNIGFNPIRMKCHLSKMLCMALCLISFAGLADTAQPFTINNTEVHVINSKFLGRSYDIYVKLPNGYHHTKNHSAMYPVIYLNDGPYTFQVASGVTHLPMGGANKFNPAILVGISFAHGEHGMSSRVRDLTPWVDPTWKNYTTGGAAAYLKFIKNEVFPMIEGKFRAETNSRTLVGQSLGGSFGSWVLLTEPGLFANYVLTSPSLWYKNRLIFDLERQFADQNTDLKAKVYLAVGELETTANGMKQPMVSQMLEFADVLSSRSYPSLELKSEVISGAIHETTFPQAFTRAAHWLFDHKKSTQ